MNPYNSTSGYNPPGVWPAEQTAHQSLPLTWPDGIRVSMGDEATRDHDVSPFAGIQDCAMLDPEPERPFAWKKAEMSFPIDQAPPGMLQALAPRLWDEEPEGVVHIAGACITLFGMFMRQRCDWCGAILLEYDLRRVAVPAGQDAMPGNWAPGSLVRVDGNMTAEIANPQEVEGEVQLPPDSCAYNPQTQVGSDLSPTKLKMKSHYAIPGLNGTWKLMGMSTTDMADDGECELRMVQVGGPADHKQS